MPHKAAYPILAAALLALPACTTADDPSVRTSSLGNAIAANTVMQMVDPWPAGVDDTNLETPADHGERKTEDNGNDGPKTTQ